MESGAVRYLDGLWVKIYLKLRRTGKTLIKPFLTYIIEVYGIEGVEELMHEARKITDQKNKERRK